MKLFKTKALYFFVWKKKLSDGSYSYFYFYADTLKEALSKANYQKGKHYPNSPDVVAEDLKQLGDWEITNILNALHTKVSSAERKIRN